MTILITVLSCVLLFYTAAIVWVLSCITLKKKKQSPRTKSIPGMSIVIPFRNESANLPGLLKSLAVQQTDIPVEIVLVNDGSTDDSVPVVESFRPSSPHQLTLIHSTYDKSRNLTSKQQALDTGIRQARFDCIVLTDADMVFAPGWIESLRTPAEKNTDLVYGHTAIVNDTGKPYLTKWQSYQLEFLFAISYVFHRSGISGSSMGNNMLLNRQAYLAIGGQDALGYSIVEDRDLYAAFIRHGYTVDIPEPFTCDARTAPCTTFKQFYHQVRRWAFGGFSIRSNLLIVAILSAVQNFAFVVSIFNAAPAPVAFVSIVNFFLTWGVLALAFRKIRSVESAALYPLFFVVLLFETVVFGLSFIFHPSIVWKERRL